jgi:hypothetical protein
MGQHHVTDVEVGEVGQASEIGEIGDSGYLQRLARYAMQSDLNNPCISYYGRLRFYSLQHTCQELNSLSDKTLGLGPNCNPENPTQDLERLRFLLHEQGNL